MLEHRGTDTSSDTRSSPRSWTQLSVHDLLDQGQDPVEKWRSVVTEASVFYILTTVSGDDAMINVSLMSRSIY